jgi:hypothetical protein
MLSGRSMVIRSMHDAPATSRRLPLVMLPPPVGIGKPWYQARGPGVVFTETPWTDHEAETGGRKAQQSLDGPDPAAHADIMPDIHGEYRRRRGPPAITRMIGAAWLS